MHRRSPRTLESAPQAAPALIASDGRIGEVYLSAEQLEARVSELGAEVTEDYAGREPVLVGLLKASVVFLADLSRAITLTHQLDFVELAGYGKASTGGHARIRVLQDLSLEIADRDVLVIEDVVDTGLTLNYLCKLLTLRAPRTLAVATLLDRPYRRLVRDLPVRYIGFTVPDEFYVGYGFDLDERYRNLPDLRVVQF